MSATPISFAPHAQGRALVDSHTPIHATVGFVAGLLGMDPHLAVAILIGAKIVEASLREGPAHALFEPEHGQSLGNELTDLLFEVGGLHYGHLLRERMLEAKAQQTAGIGRYHQPNHVTPLHPYALRNFP